MPFMQVTRGDKIANYTRGADGKTTGKPHGVFPNTPSGRRRAAGQMRVLWDTLEHEKATAVIDYPQLESKVARLQRLALNGAFNWGIVATNVADALENAAFTAPSNATMHLRAAASRVRSAGQLRLGGPQTIEKVTRLLQDAQATIHEAGGKAMLKDISSANVGASIPDDDTANAKFYKGAEVYIKSLDMFGVIRSVLPRRKGYLYHVDSTAGFTICAAGDLIHAGTKAMKALASKRDALIKLCDAAELSEDDVATLAKAIGVFAKAVSADQRVSALSVMAQVKAAFAILHANPKAVDMAKTFLKAGADQLGGLDDEGEGVSEEGRKVRPHDENQMKTAESGAAGAAKALGLKIKAIGAAHKMTTKDQDDLLESAEVLRAYATASDDPEQLDALAGLEEAVFSEPDPDLSQWADRVLKMVDDYQAHVAQVGM